MIAYFRDSRHGRVPLGADRGARKGKSRLRVLILMIGNSAAGPIGSVGGVIEAANTAGSTTDTQAGRIRTLWSDGPAERYPCPPAKMA